MACDVRQVLPDGRLVLLTELGQHLAPDDELEVGCAAAAEERWRAVNAQASALIGRRGFKGSSER